MTTSNAMICIGHRGAKGHEPENTMRSFRKALEFGVPWIEFDVWLVEGVPVVFHDQRFDRVTNGKGYVPEASLSYLKTLDAGKGEHIPLLHEVLEELCGKVSMNIELKGPGSAEPALAVLNEFLKRGAITRDRLLISSFNHLELQRVKELDKDMPIGALVCGIPVGLAAFAEALGARTVNQSVEFTTPEFIADAHQRGLRVFVYTVNNEDDVRRLADWGVDAVFSDFPDMVLETLRRRL